MEGKTREQTRKRADSWQIGQGGRRGGIVGVRGTGVEAGGVTIGKGRILKPILHLDILPSQTPVLWPRVAIDPKRCCVVLRENQQSEPSVCCSPLMRDAFPDRPCVS